jgi:hypothetical protein
MSVATHALMRILSAAILALSCVIFAASCVLGPEPGEVQGSTGTESTVTGERAGEAQEPVSIGGFNASGFPFVTTVEDDGNDEAGGWQEARANLAFTAFHLPPRRWTCPVTVGVPIRTKFMGRIGPMWAARASAEIATEAMRLLDWKLQPVLFCQMFRGKVLERFRSNYPLLGATVAQ